MSTATNSDEPDDTATAEMVTDTFDALAGKTIDGRFRIVDIIGRGAMGKVYRAVQVPLNRTVAIKVLDSRYGAGRDESLRQRFLVEAALTSKLNHPNTVRVLDYGITNEGLFFLAMEYLDGETLEAVLNRGPLPWHRVLSIAQQMARALREAHELGVVHRDLKPGNVVLLHAADDTDFVKVLDFGLVKSFVEGRELEGRAITQQGMLIGSPQYMAPEQGEKNRADPRSDIYSLGTMLFEMLSGGPPYTGTGALEVILKHVHEPLPALSAPPSYEAIPSQLKAIVTKCLAKSPMDRFQSMGELLFALQDLAEPRSSTQEFPMTEVETRPRVSSLDAIEVSALRRSRFPLFIPVFAAAALAGALGAWALMRPTSFPKVTIHLESNPAGANVSIDGKVLGRTPLDLEQRVGEDLNATIEMRLEKEGFVPASIKVTSAGGFVGLTQTLLEKQVEPTPATLKVEPKSEVKKTGPRSPNARPSGSKLSDDDEPRKGELRRPTAQP